MKVSKDYAVQMHGITKMFGNFYAIKDVDLNVEKSSIHAILGENGAGKSTLMNVLYGLYQADCGKVYIDGQEVNIKNPNDAIGLGIGMVHQHFMLVENFTVLQNIILGNEITKGLGIINTKKARKEIEQLSEKYGLFVDLNEKIENISVGMQQRVEILKALYRGADILILDEPTAVLTPQEIKELISIMNQLTNDGKTIIIITHKLKEIKASAKDCTIVRKGEYVGCVSVKDESIEHLAEKMVGQSVSLETERTPADPSEVVLEVQNLKVKSDQNLLAVKDFSIKVRAGEIVGIAGIDGNGQKELLEAITNLRKTESGIIKVNGKEIQNTSVKKTLDCGVAVVPEDRHKRGIILDFSVEDNIITENFKQKPLSNRGILNRTQINKYAKKVLNKYDVRPSGCEKMPIRKLSGGNQQKVVVAREIFRGPELLIVSQPTRGLDVGAISNIHSILVSERDKGKAILLVSLELDEILDISDSIGVIYDGTIVKTLPAENANENEIGLLMAGGQSDG